MKFALAAAFVALATTAAQAQTVPDACPVRADTVVSNGGLERSRAAVANGELTILALGSSSVEGAGASRRELGFVPLLELGLEQRLPGVAVTAINRGIGGETAADTASRLEKELTDHPADLVIWQLGTNDVLRNRPLNDILADLHRGLTVLERAGVDIVLLDSQRLPEETQNEGFRGRNPPMGRAARALAMEAEMGGYAMARRFEPMADWSGLPGGGVGPDDLHLNDSGYACWAANTAEGLAAGLR